MKLELVCKMLTLNCEKSVSDKCDLKLWLLGSFSSKCRSVKGFFKETYPSIVIIAAKYFRQWL